MKSNPYYLYGYVDYHIRFFIHNKLLRNKVIKQIDKLDKIQNHKLVKKNYKLVDRKKELLYNWDVRRKKYETN